MNRRVLWQVVIGVVCVHVCFLVWMGMTYQPKIAPYNKPLQLLAKTVELKPKVPVIAQQKTPPKQPIAAVKPKPKPKPKPKQQPKAKPEPKKQSKVNDKKQKLLAEAKKKLAQVSVPTSSQVEVSLPLLELDRNTPESAYYDSLISTLQTQLRLAEPGAVTLHLHLKRNGTVSHIEIVSSVSPRNQKIVESKLPHLKFPPFDQAFGKDKEHEFLITLTA